jgi:hypothetical protein
VAAPVRHRAQRGIAEALRTGYLTRAAQVLVFYPADLQFKPEDIPQARAARFWTTVRHGHGLQAGQVREGLRLARIYNGPLAALFDVPVRDLNNVKAYRREIMAASPCARTGTAT